MKHSGTPLTASYLAVLILTVFSIFQGYAQDDGADMEDVILMKTAEVIRGEIVESDDEKAVWIRVDDGTVRKVPKDEIEEVLRLKKLPRSRAPVGGGDILSGDDVGALKKKNLLTIIGIGIGYGPDDDESLTAKFNLVFGYDILGMGSIGVGAGVRAVPQRESLILPLYLDLRTAFLKSKVSPYMGVAGGAAWLLNQDAGNDAGDVFIHAEVGVRFKKDGRSAIHVGLSIEEAPVYKPPSTNGFFIPSHGSLGTLNTFGLEASFVF